jgi:formylglycine-generating enzyme required for sulfatase activity
MISSGEARQKVADDGVFREKFLDAISGRNPRVARDQTSGFVTGDDVGLFLREQIANTTGNRQTPVVGKLTDNNFSAGDFVFQLRPDARLVEPGGAAAWPSQSEAFAAWEQVKGTSSVPVLEAFIAQFPATVYGALARERVAQVRSAEAQRLAALNTEAKSKADAEAAARAKVEADKKAAESKAAAAAAEAARKRDPVAALTPGAGKTEFARDTLADGSPCPFCPEMVVLPKGQFEMGSNEANDEKPPHTVTIPKPVAVGRHPVTRGEFAAFVKDSGHKTGGGCSTYDGSNWKHQPDKSWRAVGFEQTDRHPVVCVNSDDASAYATWLAAQTGKAYRLLSEAEWEYAARAETTNKYWWGDDIGKGNANCDGCGSQWDNKQTAPVGSFKPNPWGLYDVHGSVWQWTADCWHDSYKGAPKDSSAWTDACADDSRRVLRGGSWVSYPRTLQSAIRRRFTSTDRYDSRGFRVALPVVSPRTL